MFHGTRKALRVFAPLAERAATAETVQAFSGSSWVSGCFRQNLGAASVPVVPALYFIIAASGIGSLLGLVLRVRSVGITTTPDEGACLTRA